jgi:hypothetical protein
MSEAITLGQVRRFLAGTGCVVKKVQPIIDPQETPPVDGYEIPRRIREAMFLRMPASCFPYAAGASGWILITPSRIYRWPVVAHPVGPGYPTWGR